MMHTRPDFPARRLLVACALGACLATPAAFAAGSASSADIQARYELDVQRCNSGQTNQDKATCLQEAGAARDEANRHRLTSSNQAYDKNQTQRCEALPASEREDCLLQMSAPNTATQSTTVTGSVGGGGVLRETTITMPAAPTTSPATPAMPASPATPAIPVPGTHVSPMPGNSQ
ncbi:hypothetical protein LKR43_09900 [Pusillimonas sp. MFBS29]|uniref:hypothetical protein n=1 Tax=Pusillimonas sp. MFBS29 TaxID=2886690 RepID=UPI001D12CF66|nr:hypothetical protein [Pusillimonas sp. MFBS29]MCC2596651.1 hypothetical protein [Pusillimonas sp. MFBS29]